MLQFLQLALGRVRPGAVRPRRWRPRARGAPWPAVVDGALLYANTHDKKVYALDAATGPGGASRLEQPTAWEDPFAPSTALRAGRCPPTRRRLQGSPRAPWSAGPIRPVWR
ncbi:PQQ-binding-like beta-propeller repeat protein [Streptomyces sp. NPDC005492]|uniref:PQQ-binding-like beta-propeller repeat protein n=1 Tax=Streptomyces sp. NPDC005492 TaxID=3156883 RepID=UPI0033B46AB0